MKFSSETLQKLPYFWNLKTSIMNFCFMNIWKIIKYLKYLLKTFDKKLHTLILGTRYQTVFPHFAITLVLFSLKFFLYHFYINFCFLKHYILYQCLVFTDTQVQALLSYFPLYKYGHMFLCYKYFKYLVQCHYTITQWAKNGKKCNKSCALQDYLKGINDFWKKKFTR